MPGAPFRLRCEFASNPLGVTRRHPRLSWCVNDTRPAELQTAYEIMVASSDRKLAADNADLWHSGRVESDQCSHVACGATDLNVGQGVWWKVRTYDSDGLASPWSDHATFRVGPADAGDWHGQWIASPLRGSRSRGVHAVALRREFILTQRAFSASLFVCALGDYRLEINGRPVPGADCNASWSDFSGQAYYQSFDITHLLKAEPNCIGLLLADGYFAGALPGVGRANYGDRPQVLVQLDIILETGELVRVTSDGEWLWRPSWVLAADVFGGEHVDARQYIEGWSEPGIVTDGWAPAELLPVPSSPSLQLLTQPFSGFSARQMLQPADNPRTTRHGARATTTFDFGEAIVGRIQLQLLSAEADEVLVSYALQSDFGVVTQDSYTSAGAEEMFVGHFTLHSFRYVRVEYSAEVTRLGDIRALRLSPAEAPSLQFSSDHSSLNNLFAALQSSLQNVALTVPLKGMAPDERLPDAAYAATWVPFYAQQSHARAVLGKWLADLRYAFNATTAARLGDAEEAPVGQSMTVPALPRANVVAGQAPDEFARFETLVRTLWTLYRHHDDVDLLRDCYGEIRVAALSYRHATPHFLRTSPAASVYGDGASGELVATACMHSVLRTTARIAGVLGHLGDYELLEKLADQVRQAFRRRYLSQDGHLLGDSQSAYVAALYHQVLEEDEQATAQQRLAELLQQHNYHIDLAPILIHALLPVLTAAGRLDLAYMVLLQTSEPSWLATIEQHPGCIGLQPGRFDIANAGLWEWLLESLIGLRLHEDYSANRNGYRSVRVRPMPPLGAQFLAGSPVRFVEASLQTLHGRFEIKWWIRQACFELELLVPPGCDALVTMPDGIEQQIRSGHHRFMMDFGAGGDGVPTLLELAGGAT